MNIRVRMSMAAVVLLAASLATAATYSWNRTANNSWATSTNWTPTRGTPAVTDTLRFANGSLDTITDLPTQTVSRVVVAGGTTARLMTSGGSHTLTISGSLQVDAGSSFDPSATNQANTVLITLAAGAAGTIDGSMLFQGANHKLDAATAGAIHFRSGSSCIQDTMVGGNLFTNAGTANAVYFDSGSVFNFQCNQGANPFGLGQPSSKVVFSHGSLYRHLKNVLPSFSGRAYADFEMNCPGANFSATGGAACAIDTLRIVAGRLKLNLTRRVSVLGNIVCGGGASDSLIFNPAGVCSLVLGGAAVQAIRGASPLFLAGGEDLFVNNPSGVLLQRPLTVNRALYLQSGTVTTGNDTLTVASDSAVVRGSGYVIGNLSLHVATGNPSKIFTVGTADGYSPAQVDFNTVSTAGLLNLRCVDGPHPNIPTPDSCLQRYWSCTNRGVAFTDYNATFTYLAADFTGRFTEAADESGMLPAKYDGSWSFPAVGTRSPGGPADGGSIQVSNVTAFSDYVIVKNGPMAVQLSMFTAVARDGSVLLRWRTESERQTYQWIIQRSDRESGGSAEAGRVAAQGSSSSPHDYTWSDNITAQGQAYWYRLAEVDLDGSVSYFGPVSCGAVGRSVAAALTVTNAPNPFVRSTTISFQAPRAVRASLRIYNATGQLVRTLDGGSGAGLRRVPWDGKDDSGRALASGVYLCRIDAGGSRILRKMLMMK